MGEEDQGQLSWLSSLCVAEETPPSINSGASEIQYQFAMKERFENLEALVRHLHEKTKVLQSALRHYARENARDKVRRENVAHYLKALRKIQG